MPTVPASSAACPISRLSWLPAKDSALALADDQLGMCSRCSRAEVEDDSEDESDDEDEGDRAVLAAAAEAAAGIPRPGSGATR